MKGAFAVLIHDTQILLTQRRDVPVWVLPGGGIEKGETPEEACIREVKEETGLEAKFDRLALHLYPVNRLGAETFVFKGISTGGLLTVTEETRSVAWFPVNELPLELFSPHKLWIQEALANEKLIKRGLVEVNYFSLFRYFLKHPFRVLRYVVTIANR